MCGSHVSRELNLNLDTLLELASEMIVSFIINEGYGNRSHFREFNKENVLLGANLSNLTKLRDCLQL